MMDLMRSCYSTRGRVCANSLHTWKLEWFFCEPTAKVFPTWHSFGSLNYVENPTDTGIGELPGYERPWRNGGGAPPEWTGDFTGAPGPLQTGLCTVADTPTFKIPCWPMPVSNTMEMQLLTSIGPIGPWKPFTLAWDGQSWSSGILSDLYYPAPLSIGVKCGFLGLQLSEDAPLPTFMGVGTFTGDPAWGGISLTTFGSVLRFRWI